MKKKLCRNIEITQLLPPGHKLGEPAPLFAKLEPAKVEELKKKFAGKENGGLLKTNGIVEKPVIQVSQEDIKKLEEAISVQVGEKVVSDWHFDVSHL